MSPVEDKEFSNLDLVKAFTVEGLANARLSPGTVTSARLSEQPVTWKLGRSDDGDPLSSKIDLLAEKYMSPDQGVEANNGLRLLASLGWRSDELIGGIVRRPGYQAAANVSTRDAAFKSFAIDPSPFFGLPNYLKLGQAPAFGWPIPVKAPQALADSLSTSAAMQRGFTTLTPEPSVSSPSILAEIVELEGDGFAGPYLSLRFLSAGATATPFPPRLSPALLGRSEPLVLLPLQGRGAGSVLTDFVYELSHNLPIDVAAWQAVRLHGYGQETQTTPPLVMASRAFLNQARLSDTIPTLQARLERLGPDIELELSPDDLLNFNIPVFDQDFAKPTVGIVRDILTRRNQFVWDQERDSASSLIKITRDVDRLEQETPPRAPAPSARIGWSKVLDKLPSPILGGGGFLGGGRADAIDLKAILKSVVGAVTQKAAAPSDQPVSSTAEPLSPLERYTNVKVLDGTRELKSVEPLVVARPYTFDVSIGTKREGVTAASDDQPPVPGFGQIATANIWVVVSDETNAGSGTGGAAFNFDKRIDSLILPLEGKSDSSAKFKITPNRDAFASGGRGRIGIRLYHKLNLIDHLELDIYVAATAQAGSADGRPAFGTTFMRPADDGGIEPPDNASAPRALTITISRTAGTDLYRFAFVAAKDPSGKPDLIADKVLPETTLNDYVSRFREILLRTVFGASLKDVAITEGQRDQLIHDLSELGAEIILKLFDYESSEGDLFALGKMVREALPDTSLVQVALSKGAEDFIFPWQILTLDPAAPITHDNLWGYRFVVEIKRMRDGADSRPPAVRILSSAKLRYARFNFINEPSHYSLLQEAICKARKTVVIDQPVIESPDAFMAALAAGGGDFLYVYAHGHAAAPSTPAGLAFNNRVRLQIEAIAQNLKQNPLASAEQSAAWTDTYKLLLKATSNTSVSSLALKNFAEVPLNDLLKQPFRLRDAPIVFLNTCESAQIWNAVEGSFVGFFLKRGARAVLGTESTIPIVFADVFGLAVLKELFAGQTLGEAVMTARKTLFADKNNPLGLCYSVYGDANASLFSKPAATDQGVIS